MSVITLDHGAGGAATAELVANHVIGRLGSTFVGIMSDSVPLHLDSMQIALTTDLFTVTPLFFTDGDIGKMAVCGTVNDIAVSGARPCFITLGMLIEEGFLIRDIDRIVDSIRTTAEEAGVKVACGDTKVMPRGSLDGIVLGVSGIGVFKFGEHRWETSSIRVGDGIIVTGEIGNHTVNLLSHRAGLGFEAKVPSDCAPLSEMLQQVRSDSDDSVHCARDATRGGVGTVLAELAHESGLSFVVVEQKMPIRHETRMACDMLGLDPIYLANEGCACLFVPQGHVERVLKVLRAHRYGRYAAVIGSVRNEPEKKGMATIVRQDGRTSVLAPVRGLPLARLC